jgi:hypothetical protein
MAGGRRLRCRPDAQPGSDHCALADPGTGEDDGTHADEHTLADWQSCVARPVPNGSLGTDREREAGITVKDDILLQVQSAANLDPLEIAAFDEAETQRRLVMDDDITGKHCAQARRSL